VHPAPLPTPSVLGDHLRLGALRSPDRIALAVVDGESETYRELDTVTNRAANALLAAGLERGDRLAIWMANDLEYLHVYLAGLKAGLVVVQLNVRHTAAEADYQLQDSGAVALVFDDSAAERVEQLSTRDLLRVLIAVGEDRVGGARDWSRIRDAGSARRVDRGPVADDLAVIAYTSGTSGFPKGAELTHRSMRALGATNALSNRYVARSTQVFGLSLSFAAGIPAHVLPHLQVGGTTHLMPAWDTERLVDAIDELRATFTVLPSPPIPEFCEVVNARRTTLPSLVSVLHSTSKAPEQHLRILVETIGPRLVEGWGMTENSGGLVAATTRADYESARPGIYASTGVPVPDAVVRVLDDDDQDLPHDGTSIGQLVFHSGSLARGYWNRPDASAQSFRDGWYHSGDLGSIDPDGYVTVQDRRTDLILSGGMNVYPSEIERVLLEVEGVVSCAVVAAPHERWGQVPVAFVVRSDGRVGEAELLGHARGQLAGYKVPTTIRFVDSLPVNASNKVLRRELRDLLEREDPRSNLPKKR